MAGGRGLRTAWNLPVVRELPVAWAVALHLAWGRGLRTARGLLAARGLPVARDLPVAWAVALHLA
ncbi:hypothetical protein ACK1X7_06005 [Streptomyces sp. CY1]|uniref:hypothetical protein n=1 Tax=Streptomyces sp. CY1 TaxID=3388313 RepID=UPI0039A0E26F